MNTSEGTMIVSTWKAIDEWLGINAPEVLDDLNPGADESAILAAQKSLGIVFPPDFRASLGVHDGQSRDGPGLFPSGTLLSLETMVDEWGIWKELLEKGEFRDAKGDAEGAVREDWWNLRWIPITYDGAGNHECLDLAPAPSGRVGQVIQMYHDDADRRVSADSFAAWLTAFHHGLMRKELVYSDDYGCIVPVEDA